MRNTEMNGQLLFICGFPSSGTDLLKNIINAHSDILICGEFPFLPKLADDYAAEIPVENVDKAIAKLKQLDVYNNLGNPNFRLERCDRQSYSLAKIYASLLTDRQVSWKGNKTPQNTENIDKLTALFPNAKFILLVRDIRDVCLSAKNKWGKNEILWAAKWNQRMQQGYKLLNELDRDFLVLRYEDLLQQLDSEIPKICSWLNVEYQNSMLDYHLSVQDSIDGKLNYGKPLITDNTGKWQQGLCPRTIKRIEEIAFPSLQIFNYEMTMATKNQLVTYPERIWGLIGDLYSLLFIGNRANQKSNNLANRLKNIIFEFQKRLA